MSEKLPPLPECRVPDEHGIGWFTAGQMQAYALLAIRESEAVTMLREARGEMMHFAILDRFVRKIDAYLASLEQK